MEQSASTVQKFCHNISPGLVEMDDSFFFDSSKFKERVTSYSALSWRTCLGLAAWLDFLATVLPRQLRVVFADDEAMPDEYQLFGQSIPDIPFGTVLRFLDHNCGYIGFTFSMLCCVEAFMDASRNRNRALMKRDKKRLLRIKKDDEDEDLVSINLIDDLGYLDDNFDSWMAFYFRLFVQLMLLPVGFYWLMSKGIFLEAQMDLHDAQGEQELKEIIRDTYDVDKLRDSSTLTRDKNLSLGFSIVRQILDVILSYAHAKGLVAKKAIFKELTRFVRKVIGKAIRNPLKFTNNVKRVLTALRWIKYLQPIAGASNKLKGNLADLTKKFKQRKMALVAQRVRRRLLRKMTEEERRWYAANKIQSIFRGHRIRKSIRALHIFQGKKEIIAVLKLQTVFRAALKRARARIERKMLEFERLKKKSGLDQIAQMSSTERRRMYELEEDLQLESARLLSLRMLMKPNTKFAVTWKVVFCVCVIFEITGLVWNPMLKKYKDDATGGALSVQTVLKGYIMPVPLSELKECSCQSEVARDWKRKLLFALQRKQPLQCEPLPWFCRTPYSAARSSYIHILNFLIDEFLLIVGLVVAFDVPISFLTGEIDDETGVLKPKPFFKRWILPGLALQLLVNPKMARTSEVLWRFLHQIFEIGPVRVWRWTSALFYPLFVLLFDFVERHMWAPYVHDQNHQSILSQAKSRVIGKHKDLEDSIKKLSAL